MGDGPRMHLTYQSLHNHKCFSVESMVLMVLIPLSCFPPNYELPPASLMDPPDILSSTPPAAGLAAAFVPFSSAAGLAVRPFARRLGSSG